MIPNLVIFFVDSTDYQEQERKEKRKAEKEALREKVGFWDFYCCCGC
jgi:hypothetical protein